MKRFSKDRRPMLRKGLLVLVLLTVSAGCPRNRSVEEGGTRMPALSDKPYPVTCDDAHRYAARALRARQYKITEVTRSAAGGLVVGIKDGQETRMTITCGGDGTRLKATGGGSWVEQGLQFSFHLVAEKGDRFWPPPKAPRVQLELIEGPEIKLWFPQDLSSAGVAAVRVRIFNGGSRDLRLDPNQITAASSSGQSVRALPAAEVRKRLAGIDPGIGERVLQPLTLKNGNMAKGFVFFPAGSYVSGTVQLVDVPTGEADGYEVSFTEPPAP